MSTFKYAILNLNNASGDIFVPATEARGMKNKNYSHKLRIAFDLFLYFHFNFLCVQLYFSSRADIESCGLCRVWVDGERGGLASHAFI